MSLGWFDHTEPSLSTSLQGKQGMQGVMHLFGVVPAHQTSSNFLEPHYYRDSKVCRVLSHEFGVVRPYKHTYGMECSLRKYNQIYTWVYFLQKMVNRAMEHLADKAMKAMFSLQVTLKQLGHPPIPVILQLYESLL